MVSNKKFTQGIYKPLNPKKYIGNVKNITYRSSWELSYLFKLDTDPNVISFSSEETIIPYVDYDKTVRRYFVDFKVTRKLPDGSTITELIEIKPYAETIPPMLKESKAKKSTKLYKAFTWDKNQRKWDAARKYCQKRGWEFRIITEKDMPVWGRK